MSRNEPIGRNNVRTQSTSGPPVTDMVKVAVLPPRLPEGVAPSSSGIATADMTNWDERLNWRHNQPIRRAEEETPRRKSFLKKISPTTQRQARNPELPPFMFRYVSYDVWRKHYAKDKDGNYRGTHAPAEDCLLKTDDVRKWNGGEATTMADKWTRGKDALPVYAEVREEGVVPEYEVDYDGPPRDDGPPPEEQIVTREDDEIAARLERSDMTVQKRRDQEAALEEYSGANAAYQAPQAYTMPTSERAPGQTIDGRSSDQIIAEAKLKGPVKTSGKTLFRRGFEMASVGFHS